MSFVLGRCSWHNQRLNPAGTISPRSLTKRFPVSQNAVGRGESSPVGRPDTCASCCHSQRSGSRRRPPPNPTPSDTTVEGMVGCGHCTWCSVF